MQKNDVLFLLSGFPIPTQTFVFREVDELFKIMPLRIVAFTRKEKGFLEDKNNVVGRVEFAPNNSILIVLFFKMLLFRLQAFWKIFFKVIFFKHRNTKQRFKLLKKFPKTLWLYDHLKDNPPRLIHAHFIGWQTEIALIISEIFGVRFSSSAHAMDIFVLRNNLEEKLRKALFVVTGTQFNVNFMQSIYPQTKKIHLVFDGVKKLDHSKLDFTKNEKITFISVGRLVYKKGFQFLIEASKILDDKGFNFETLIIGDGELREQLETKVKTLKLENKINFLGSMENSKILQLFAKSTAFVLPCVEAENGDIDGIPLIIVEAMFTKIPVISSRISGIPEIVKDNETGLLCEEKNVRQIAEKMELIATDRELAKRLSENALAFVEENFEIEKTIAKLYSLFEKYLEEI
ncbi:glycosyltransferase [bacterium]|nr:glycosyltransferase [bacterium]